MTTLLSILMLGFFLGMRHATDADHVVAVTNIVSRQQSVRGAAWTGILWGIGHTLTVVAFGGAIVIFGLVISRRMGLGLELSVAVMLIVLGLMNLNAAFGWFGDRDAEWRRAEEESARLQRWLHHLRPGSPLRPLLIGVVHGLAGSAAIALLVLPLIRSTAGAVAYLFVFGAGTIVGMMLVTAAMAVPMRHVAGDSSGWSRMIGGIAGAASFGFGAFLFYQIGFVEKLFLPGA